MAGSHAVEIDAQTEADRDQVRTVLALATADLRRIYRPRGPGAVPVARKRIRNVLVARRGERVVGVVEYALRQEAVFLQGLAVHPGFRKQGVARALVRHLEDIARRAGKSALTLSTIEQTGNADVFRRLGFAVHDKAVSQRFEGTDGREVTQLLMRRRVDC